MKIALVVAGLPPEALGGAETQAARTAAHLALRHDVLVFTRTATVPGFLLGAPRCRVVRRSAVRVPVLRFGLDLIQGVARIAAMRRRIDAIVAYQTVIDGLLAVLAGMLCDRPVLVWVRSEEEFRLRASRQSRWLSPWVFRHARMIAVQSESLRGQLLGELRSAGRGPLAQAIAPKIRVIPNGVAIGTSAAGGDPAQVLYVGRLAADKGVIHLLEAMRRCPQAALTVVGDGPERPRLEAAARGMVNVRFAGRCDPDEVPAYMARAGMLVLPSLRNEGLPNVVLEAMAAGVPVIASRNAGIPDLISDRETGLLVEPGDADGLARGIGSLVADSGLRERIRANAHERVGRYGWPAVVAAIEDALGAIARPA
ncbi:MAG: glycosyltransferase family 4 protein [Gammaproteobacteria bacterium]